MKKKQSVTHSGTICFVIEDDLNHIINVIGELIKIPANDWKYLIVTNKSQEKDTSSIALQRLCRKSKIVDCLTLEKTWQAETIVPLAHKIISAIETINSTYAMFVTDYEKPNLTGLNNFCKKLKKGKIN